jgi:hypothetical protein
MLSEASKSLFRSRAQEQYSHRFDERQQLDVQKERQVGVSKYKIILFVFLISLFAVDKVIV